MFVRLVPTRSWFSRSWLLSLGQRVFATGNTLRRVAQLPVVQGMLNASLAGAGPGIAVDVGAGGGEYSCGMYTFDCLAASGFRVIAVDPEELFCRIIGEKAAERGTLWITALRAVGEALPLKSQCADTVLCTEVLTYMEDDRRGAQEIVRVLRDGGQAIISVPLPPEPARPHGARREGYSPQELEKLLADAGLTIVERQTCMYGLSRLVIRAEDCCWRLSRGRLHLPLLFLVHLERWLEGRGIRFGKPYCLILRAVK